MTSITDNGSESGQPVSGENGPDTRHEVPPARHVIKRNFKSPRPENKKALPQRRDPLPMSIQEAAIEITDAKGSAEKAVSSRGQGKSRRGGRKKTLDAALPGNSGDAAQETEQFSRRRNRRGRKVDRQQGQVQQPVNLPAVVGSLIFSPLEEIARAYSESSPKKPQLQKPGCKKASKIVLAPRKRMFISVLQGEQVEVGIAEEGVLLEYYLDMLHQSKIKGNIYKGIIHNIDSNLQAAFVNYGEGRNGFLQIDEVHPEYWQIPQDKEQQKKFPPIQKALRPGQEVLVQVVKEPTGNKGAFLTTWLSLAGRFLVLTPGQEQIGVSRKVKDAEERDRLRELMMGIDPGGGVGAIVRTVGEGATKTILKTDLQYLKRLWRDIRKRATEVTAPALVHQEPGLSERAVRDYLTEDVGEIWVDNEQEAKNVREMVALLFPRKKDLVRLYDARGKSIWEHFSLQRQLDEIYAREVMLPSGGRLVFDQTEALMAIDINSGRISGKGNFEAMAFKTNMEAAEIIARQLRLRDVGGQIVIDFIEMRDKKHIAEVEKTLRQAMKNDRARHDVAHMSTFGLLELVRQRMGSSALSISLESCPACGGTGLRRNMEWQALRELADLRERLQMAQGVKYVLEAPKELGLYLLNCKRDVLSELERDYGKSLEVRIRF